MKKSVYSTKTGITALTVLISAIWAFTPAFGTGDPAGKTETANTVFKVVLGVKGMTCSGCAANIKKALDSLKGVRDVRINVAGGRADVWYDTTQLTDTGKIAEAVTSSGYPAKIVRTFSADEVKRAETIAEAKSGKYIASVDGLQIPRADFDVEIGRSEGWYTKMYGEAVMKTPRGKALLDGLKKQIFASFIAEAVKLQAVRKAKYTVDGKTIASELAKLAEKKGVDMDGLKKEIEKDGYSFEYFKRKFEKRTLITKYLEEFVYKGATEDDEKKQLYTNWFKKTQLSANVVVYDKELEILAGRGVKKNGICGIR